MRYERPTIVRRERIAALLGDAGKSEVTVSDVNIKDNVQAVVWGASVEYSSPAIAKREPLHALLDVSKSER